MKVKSVSVLNFRNLSEQTVRLGDGLNIFVGQNAQGKTNLLESIYLCCLGKSPRTDKNSEMINYDKQFARVSVNFSSRYGDADIGVVVFSNKKKSITVNSVPVLKTGELLGYLNAVYFGPEELRIVKSSPDNRRRFLDVDLSQTDKNYFYTLVNYNKVLSQRNTLIKTTKDVDALAEMLFVWDTQLARDCAKIVTKRKAFCQRLKQVARDTHFRLSGGKEELELIYTSQVKGETMQELRDFAFETFQNNVKRDYDMRYTTFGCQRDDMKFLLNGVDVRDFGSQGQQRTVALALKLAELTVFREMTGDYPILLLDDVLSELDVSRQKQLLTFDENLQIVLTATHVEEQLKNSIKFRCFSIVSGKVVAQTDYQ